MKVQLRDIREGSEALSKVLGFPKNPTGAYRLSKLTAKLMAENKHIEKTRITLVKKFGKEDEKGHFTVGPKEEDAFNKEWEEFLDGETDLGNVNPIPFTMLLGIRLTAIDMAHLTKFVEEPTDEEIEEFEKQEEEEANKLKEIQKPPLVPTTKR